MKIYKIPSKPEFSIREDFKILWTDTMGVLKPYSDKDGYLRYSYRARNKTYHLAEHRAVAEVFVKNNKPDVYKIVNHKDSDVTNNNPSNLEWVDYSINRIHSLVNGRGVKMGEDHKGSVLSEQEVHEICKLLSSGVTRKDICQKLDVKPHHVSNIKSGKCWLDISQMYNIKVPKRETFSLATARWVKYRLDSGESINGILSMSSELTEEKLKRIISYLENECND